MFNNTLIVGFGIAGVTIAHRLHNSNHKFKIISDQSQCASRTAGGVINPIALKRYKKAWKADVFYHEAIKFYRFLLETRLDADLLKSKPIYKALNSAEDQNDFLIASESKFPRSDSYLLKSYLIVKYLIQLILLEKSNQLLQLI